MVLTLTSSHTLHGLDAIEIQTLLTRLMYYMCVQDLPAFIEKKLKM